LNSKERVSAVLRLEIPDKIPYGEFSFDFDTVSRVIGHETYYRAKAKSQIAFWEGRRDEVVQSWKEDAVEFFTKLDCVDIISNCNMASSVCPPKGYVPKAPKKLDNNTWEDDEGKIYKRSETTFDITMVFDPHCWDKEYNEEDFMGELNATPPDESIFEVVDYVIEKFGKEKFILGPSGEEVGMVLLGGMERGLTEYISNPDVVKAAAKRATAIANAEDFFYIRKGTDAVLWGDDYAYKSGPMISPDMFREFVFPVLKERVSHVKKGFGLPVLKHACGNNWKLLDMFVAAGFDCYQSIQQTAGMDLKELKGKYGSQIALWGGMPLEDLISGTRDDIKRDVKYAVESAKRNGGYIFGASHSIAVGTKYDNFMTMLDEFERIRDY